ncbi:hypothetical protein C7S14_7524 [Burkholderia cepacia]|nr:hypothetical protein C7S14_7524 [Burkholderia cepacia]
MKTKTPDAGNPAPGVSANCSVQRAYRASSASFATVSAP